MLFGMNVPRKFQSASILFYVAQRIPMKPYISVYLNVSSIHRQLLRGNINRCASKLRKKYVISLVVTTLAGIWSLVNRFGTLFYILKS